MPGLRGCLNELLQNNFSILKFAMQVGIVFAIASCTVAEPDFDADAPAPKSLKSKQPIVDLVDRFVDPESMNNSWSTMAGGSIPRTIPPEFWKNGLQAQCCYFEVRTDVPEGMCALNIPPKSYLLAELFRPVPISLIKNF